jgi:NAD(P)-dependent dehydrogenase (short-subunit alcohol dehydrogenase family)
MALDGKWVVVIGGESGIRIAVPRGSHEGAAQVVIASRDRGKLEAATSTLPVGVVTEVGDMTDRMTLDRLFARVGAFDHLVLSVSSSEGAGPGSGPESLWRGYE